MKLNVFVSSVKDGIMSKDKNYFPKLTEEERNILYENTLNRFSKVLSLLIVIISVALLFSKGTIIELVLL